MCQVCDVTSCYGCGCPEAKITIAPDRAAPLLPQAPRPQQRGGSDVADKVCMAMCILCIASPLVGAASGAWVHKAGLNLGDIKGTHDDGSINFGSPAFFAYSAFMAGATMLSGAVVTGTVLVGRSCYQWFSNSNRNRNRNHVQGQEPQGSVPMNMDMT